jgi:hypothetical protein
MIADRRFGLPFSYLIMTRSYAYSHAACPLANGVQG